MFEDYSYKVSWRGSESTTPGLRSPKNPRLNRVNEGSGRIIESIETEYVNIYIYSPLSGSTYIKLLVRLRYSM